MEFRQRWRFVSILGLGKQHKWMALENVFEIYDWRNSYHSWDNCFNLFTGLLADSRRFRCKLFVSSIQNCVSVKEPSLKCQICSTFFFRLPWDQQKLVGYLAETFIAFYSAGAYLTTNGLLFTLFVSMCVQHLAFYKMFRHFVQEFDDPGEKRNDEELLCKLIEFHVITKE